ncbi:N-acetylglucosamine related transporter, NagX [Fimbriiglobus ruber]|uniref:N-acetylglucosamine related transporter, NagX n=1 Tax=Fimbriiglobus ruber TaxID=1908690 RepID=A0A225DG43_9BACT|nr:hypothetical protein [Fimbriiglobus ruber]OWK40452.1 N-acetylglucosamine related transporter, NagX [Fimbriiglobus ruber]
MVSIDAYRGTVMFLLLAEALRLAAVAKALPESGLWKFLAYHQSHVEWVGCALHDMIQPSFSFLVGVALPFSIAARTARGQSRLWMTLHAFWRALILVALGIFLRSMGKPQTNYTFEDTLTQIGLGYGFLFLLGLAPTPARWIALAVILVGYWAAFAAYPLPGPDFDWKAAGVAADWSHHLSGFAAHWNKNTNAAWAFDQWFLNLFPRKEPFLHNSGGYATLSFIPTLGTMILGLIAGDVLRSARSGVGKVLWLVVAGVVALAAGWALGEFGICPVVKRIWTPSWVLFSGGICLIALGLYYGIVDGAGCRTWAFPLAVVGANSIAAYCMEWFVTPFATTALLRHLGSTPFRYFGPEYEPFVIGCGVVAIEWLVLFWMYRRKLFLKI